MGARIARWWLAVARLLAAVGTGLVALLPLTALVAGLVLVPLFGIGVPLVARVLAATRTLADLHRREAGRVLGVPIPAPRWAAQGAGRWGVLDALRDLQTAREIVWLGAHGAGGIGVGFLAYLAIVPLVLSRSRPVRRRSCAHRCGCSSS